MAADTTVKLVKLSSPPPGGLAEKTSERDAFTVLKVSNESIPTSPEGYMMMKDCAIIQHRLPSGAIEQYFAFIIIVDTKPARTEQPDATHLQAVVDNEIGQTVSFELGGTTHYLSLDAAGQPILSPASPI